jgi:polyvinyl alcohol dehydrogenase (cytochrome)
MRILYSVTGAVLLAAGLQFSCDRPEGAAESDEFIDAEDPVEPRNLPQAPLVDGQADPADWPSYGHDLWNTRHNPVEPDHTGVTTAHIRWKVDLGGDITGTPAVVGSVVYAGAANGQVAALSAATGAPLWSVNVGAEMVTGSVAVSEGRVFVPTHKGKVWALDQATGSTLWTADLTDGKPNVTLYGSPVQADGLVHIGVASIQEYPTGNPLSFYGSQMALDPVTGDRVWARYFASGTQYGAAVWATAAVENGKVFTGTGNGYSEPASPYSDSMIALDAGSGAIDWYKQWWPDDVFILLKPEGPDYDFGASANLYWLGDKLVMGQGSKSGDYHAMDAMGGTAIWSKRLTNGGVIGGFLGSTAYADGRIHGTVNNTIGINDPRPPFLPTGGKYVTFSAATGAVLHSKLLLPTFSSPCVAGGVVYAVDVLGTIWARKAATGQLLWLLPTLEPSTSGPAISRGTLYFGSGVSQVFSFNIPNPPSLIHHLIAVDIDGA